MKLVFNAKSPRFKYRPWQWNSFNKERFLFTSKEPVNCECWHLKSPKSQSTLTRAFPLQRWKNWRLFHCSGGIYIPSALESESQQWNGSEDLFHLPQKVSFSAVVEKKDSCLTEHSICLTERSSCLTDRSIPGILTFIAGETFSAVREFSKSCVGQTSNGKIIHAYPRY